MDDTTKLSPKLLSSLLQLFKAQKGGGLQPDALFDSLNAEQQQTAKQLLSDPQKLQPLLQSPQVQSLLRSLQSKADDHGAGSV